MQSTTVLSAQASPKDTKRAEIDAKIHSFEEAILALKRERNALSPISRLPYDISAIIFRNVANNPGYEHSDLRRWIRPLTHICSHWRTVALHCPQLWTVFHFHDKYHHDLVTAKLHRSRASLLTVHYQVNKRNRENNIGLLLPALHELHRIRDLILSMPVTFFQSGVLDKLESPASALEECFIAVTQPVRMRSQREEEHWIELPGKFLPSLSNVTSLRLHHCIFDWNALVNLPRLTTLDVADPKEVQLTSDTLFHILRKLPFLEHLCLLKCLPQPTSTTIPDPIFTLNHLTTLEISGETRRCTHFLHQLAITPSLTVRVHCWDFSSHVDWLIAFISNFWKIKTSAGKPIKSLNFCHPLHYQTFNFQLEVGSETTPEFGSDMKIACSQITTALASNYFHMLLMPVDLQEVVFIQLNIALYEPLWSHLAQHAPKVKEIEFMTADVEAFCRIVAHQNDGGAYPTAFLKLNIMTFYQSCDISLDSRRGLLKYLKARHRINHPCQTLEVVSGDGFTERYVAELRKYVKTVFCEEDSASLAHLSDDLYETGD